MSLMMRKAYHEEEGTLGNAGVGAFWRLNDALSLRTEARGTYN
jgi:OOP family OmpA-OmpF porin